MKKANTPSQKPATAFSWLVMYFGLAYFCQHFAQTGLIGQPLSFYFKEVLGFGPKAVTEFMAILTIPWMIKPLYGLISDYIPLFGYRRKSYLLLLNVAATAGFIALTGMTGASSIRFALLLTAFSTAASDVLVDGLMVELGNKTGMTKRFQSQQWLWFNAASVLTALGGGYFAQHFAPATGLHLAALVTAAFPLVMVVSTWLWVKEEKSKVDLAELKVTTGSLLAALKSKTLWIVMGFLAFWQFSPSFGTPMYYHQVDNLKFSQDFIGQLGAIGSIASVIGAWLYKRYLADRFTTRQLLYASVAIGTAGTLAYLLMIDPTTTATPLTAIILGAVFGVTGVVAFLTTLNLAAEACPKRVEALTFAVLMSVFNLAGQGSALFGAYLYEDVFHSHLSPLIWVSAAFTFACFFLIPMLPKLDTEKAEGNGDSKPE